MLKLRRMNSFSPVRSYTDNKELLILPDTVHTNLYDGGGKDMILFDRLEQFFGENLK